MTLNWNRSKMADQNHIGIKCDNSIQHLNNAPRGCGGRDTKESSKGRKLGKELHREDLLCLLSMLEGELQARDEVITVLKAQMTDAALLEAHYAFRGPEKVIRALRRDSLQAQKDQLQDVYEKPMAELDHLEEAHRRTSRRMLRQLVEVERSHSGALSRLEEQEEMHRSFIQKSDDLTTLLEQDRERLKLLIVKEKEYRERKEEDDEREVLVLKDELTALKQFALLVVKEQQSLREELEAEGRRVRELTDITDHARRELSATHSRAREEELRALQLEAELRDQASVYSQTQEAMTAKLADKDAQKQQLRQRLANLSRQLDELGGTRAALRRAEEELVELRERVRWAEDGDEGGAGTASLLSEVDGLRRRVLEMEGKDEELNRMGDQCRDLDRRLGREMSQSRSLKAEVDKLNGRISQLDKLEEALVKSRQECSTLRGSQDREKSLSKQLCSELDTLRIRVRELEVAERQLENSEVAVKQDLSKLRALTVVLVEDRKSMSERLRQASEKLGMEKDQQNEQNSLITMTEKLKEEMQQALRTKADLEAKIRDIVKGKDELQTRLHTEEGKNRELQSKVNTMRRRMQVVEDKSEKVTKENGMDINEPLTHNSNHFDQTDNNKTAEMSQEVERLRRKLLEKEVVESELMKAEEDFESLELRFRKEQERSKALTQELGEAKRELSRFQLAEKQEVNQEHALLRRLQQEQVRSRLLGREVDSLKDKLQKLLGTDESISKVQMDHSTLQRKLSLQEAKNRELAREMEELTNELERYRHFSKSLRPGVNGRRFSDLHQSTKEVQTEQPASQPPDYRHPVPFAHDEKVIEQSDDEDLNPNEDEILDISGSLQYNNTKSLYPTNYNVRRYSSNSASDTEEFVYGNPVKDMVVTQTPGQPVHIKVTPEPGLNTATLEISSHTTDNAASYTSTAVIPTTSVPHKQRITIIQNAAVSAVKSQSSPTSPDRALSPLVTGPLSRMVSPNSSHPGTPDHNSSPVQIVTVSTCSPEPTEIIGQAVFRMSPERQNSWQLQRSTSAQASPSVITTTEDNKIHIHLGTPYVPALNGTAHGIPKPGGSYYSLRQEQRTQVLTNGCHIKSAGKITSSITITPATSPITHPSNITIPLDSQPKPGLTRIPKPKGLNNNRGTNRTLNTKPSHGNNSPSTLTWKSNSFRMANRPKAKTVPG
ncbi:filamin A-interacting protein 1-like [Gadus macrocephalus]|uniref:filamin A-interacting protein 1-like n=1 Tax=Gadus macrocephalus TaxID=80720 RepID=UPI0028CB652D|nr:filamin A-interacting protein 1-like [Gadus macrocephalus]